MDPKPFFQKVAEHVVKQAARNRPWNWLPICFHVQSKVLRVTFKAQHDLGSRYLRAHLFLVISTQHTTAGRQSIWVTSLKDPLQWDQEEGPSLW